MRNKGDNCQMAFSPKESPIYGGSQMVVVFSETGDLPSEDAEIFLVFQGTKSRHVTVARRLDHSSVKAIIPGHDCFESVHLSCYSSLDGAVELLSEGAFSYIQDSTYFLAHYLASSVCDLTALQNPSSIKSDRFNLWEEDMSTLDERLTAAFEHQDLSPSWRLVEDPSRLDQDPPPRETLLHFATRFNLPQFAEYLLDKPGSDVALRIPNQNGELAVTLARSHGLNDLADRMDEHSFSGSSHHPTDLSRVQSKSVTVKRHDIGTATITSSTSEASRSLEGDIQMLRDLVSFMGEEAESPPARSTGDPPSPDCFTVGSLPARLPSEMLSSRAPSQQSSQQYFSAADDDLNDRGDDEEDEDEDDEEETRRPDDIPEEPVLEESMAHLHLLNTKVQRLRASNKEYLTTEDARRESLSRFSSSCPVLADDNEKIHIPRIVLTPPPYMHILDIPMREQATERYLPSDEEAEQEEEEEEEGEEQQVPSTHPPSDSPLLANDESSSFQEEFTEDVPGIEEGPPSAQERPASQPVEIHLNDVSVSDSSRTEVAAPGQVSPSRLEGSSSPDESSEDLLEPEEKVRRHSWGPDPNDEVISPSQESQVLEGLPLALAPRSKSMGNLDVNSEEEFHDAKDILTPKSSKASVELSPDQGPSATSSPIDSRDPEVQTESADVIVDEKLDLSSSELDVTAILPPDNAPTLPTQAEIDAVPRRKKKEDGLSQNRPRQANSMFVTPRTEDYEGEPVGEELPLTPEEPELPNSPQSAPPIVMLTLTSPKSRHPIQSVVETDSDSDNSRDSDVDDAQRQQLTAAKQRKARLSLTEFLSDPRNFQDDQVQKVEQQQLQQQQQQLQQEQLPQSRVSALASSEMESSKMIRRFSFLKKTKNKKEDKDKREKDKEKRKHQFVGVSFSNSTKCDYCEKSLANRDSLQCSVCFVNVHNNSCKDHVQGCAKLTKHHKQVSKSVSSLSRDRLSTIIPSRPGSTRESGVAHTQSLREPTKMRPASSGPQCNGRGDFSVTYSCLLILSNLTVLSCDHTHLPCAHLDTSTDTGRWHWHRVAVKLGVKTIEESEEIEESTDSTSKPSSLSNNNISMSMESLDEVSAVTLEFDEDEDLVSRGTEPESWSVTAEKKVLKKMSHKEIKRQDVIFEFIKTEKHHMRTLKIMQKIFSFGMQNELKMDQTIINKVFPSLEELVQIAVQFNEALQAKQRTGQPVETIGDVLVNQFDKENGKRMMEAYAFLCSRQIEAVALYKELYKTDRKFQAFIKKCSTNALCRRWSIPECILSVTNRLTKYHLLIGAIIKPSKGTKVDKSEIPNLQKALQLIKNICQDVNVQVKEYERHQRLMEIYNKLEARSTGILKSGKKFKKSDLLSSNRKLRHEGELKWKSARGRLTEVVAVVLSDVIIFLQENNQKYTFASQDNKPPVINLYKLMVRDVAIDKCSMYLISPNKIAPEMYEVNCDTPEKRKRWKEILEQAIHDCPDEDEGVGEDAETDEEKRAAEARAAKIKKLLEQMQEKDNQLNEIMEEKAKLVEELKDTLSKDDALGTLKSSVIVDSDAQMQEAKQILLAAIAEAHRLTTAVYSAGVGLTRSASSAGERESGLFQAPALPKRAETFGGFDKQQGAVAKKRFVASTRETDNRSYSFPDLAKAEGKLTDESDSHHPAQQGSDPNLLSDSYQDRLHMHGKEPGSQDRFSDNSSRLTVDSFSSTSEDIPEGMLKDDKTAVTPDHVVSVNHLLKHLNSLLSITSKKETAYESMRSQLLEANKRIESLGGVVPKPRAKAYSMGTQGLASLPKRGDKGRSSSTTSDKNLDSKDGKGRTPDTKDRSKRESVGEGKPYEPPFSGVKASDQSLRRIAFGDISYNENSTHAGHGAQAESPKSIMKHRGMSDSRAPSEPPSSFLSSSSSLSPEKTVGGRRRDAVPEHLLSATNELQGSSGLVQQQLPLKLSSLASIQPSSSSSNKPQQMIPTKLSSLASSAKSSSPAMTRNGNRMSTGSSKSNQGSSKMNNKQGKEQNIIFF
ncbi:A-kinase anchor protein 13-like [Acanthaster planci]|uniref:A-kinase anchor protein 13-like n=1 Tax=Acanthaster planci TaxID=133434 RepID=A0A8B7Y1B0_ACAPL|nr:A-kinase anchor protein 13-like [Acanthaster planci]